MDDETKSVKSDEYMRLYQMMGAVLMIGIPEEDTDLPERAQHQLKCAVASAVGVLDALANIISIIDDPEVSDDDLL